MKLRIVTLLAALIASTAFADDKEKPKPEKTEVEYKSTTHGAIQVNGTTGDWFTVYRGKKNVGPAVPPKVGEHGGNRAGRVRCLREQDQTDGDGQGWDEGRARNGHARR